MKIGELTYRKMKPVKCTISPISTNKYDHMPFYLGDLVLAFDATKNKNPSLEKSTPYGGSPTSSRDA